MNNEEQEFEQHLRDLQEAFGFTRGQARLAASVMAGNEDGDVVDISKREAANATAEADAGVSSPENHD